MAAINEVVLGMWEFVLGPLSPVVQNLIITTMWIVVVMISVILTVAFTTYFERKVIGYMQGRIGPNRVGPLGRRPRNFFGTPLAASPKSARIRPLRAGG